MELPIFVVTFKRGGVIVRSIQTQNPFTAVWIYINGGRRKVTMKKLIGGGYRVRETGFLFDTKHFNMKLI